MKKLCNLKVAGVMLFITSLLSFFQAEYYEGSVILFFAIFLFLFNQKIFLLLMKMFKEHRFLIAKKIVGFSVLIIALILMRSYLSKEYKQYEYTTKNINYNEFKYDE